MYSHPTIAANQAYAGQAQLALQALTIPITQRVSNRIGAANARNHLYRLCKTLEKRLICPITVRTQKNVRIVTAFGVAGYRIDHARKVVTGGRVNKKGKFSANQQPVDIFHPLCKSHWIRWIIEDSGLLDQGDKQLDLFALNSTEWFIQWLADKAYQILKTTTVFRKIRKYDLPQAFGLDAELLQIALQARIHTLRSWLGNEHYSLIWKNEGDYRQVKRENPKLLPLLTTCFVEGRHNICLDPVQAIKTEIQRFEITDASWRYLTLHGARMFRIPWQVTHNRSNLNTAIYYLLELQYAGLPPPPAPSVIRTWLSPYVRDSRVEFDSGWCDIPNKVLRALLIGAEEHRYRPSLDAYCAIFHQVSEWSVDQKVQPDENQQRGGWHCLKQQYDIWKARMAYEQSYADIVWEGILFPFKHLGYTVTPIVNAMDLYMEGEAMRNCLRKYIEICANDEYLVFSIREQITGRRLAVAGLKIDYSIPECELMDVRGPANQTARPIFWDIGSLIERRIHDLLLPQDDIHYKEAG